MWIDGLVPTKKKISHLWFMVDLKMNLYEFQIKGIIILISYISLSHYRQFQIWTCSKSSMTSFEAAEKKNRPTNKQTRKKREKMTNSLIIKATIRWSIIILIWKNNEEFTWLCECIQSKTSNRAQIPTVSPDKDVDFALSTLAIRASICCPSGRMRVVPLKFRSKKSAKWVVVVLEKYVLLARI